MLALSLGARSRSALEQAWTLESLTYNAAGKVHQASIVYIFICGRPELLSIEWCHKIDCVTPCVDHCVNGSGKSTAPVLAPGVSQHKVDSILTWECKDVTGVVRVLVESRTSVQTNSRILGYCYRKISTVFILQNIINPITMYESTWVVLLNIVHIHVHNVP